MSLTGQRAPATASGGRDPKPRVRLCRYRSRFSMAAVDTGESTQSHTVMILDERVDGKPLKFTTTWTTWREQFLATSRLLASSDYGMKMDCRHSAEESALALASYIKEGRDVDYRLVCHANLCDYVAIRYWSGDCVPLRLNGLPVILGPLPKAKVRRPSPSDVREVLGRK